MLHMKLLFCCLIASPLVSAVAAEEKKETSSMNDSKKEVAVIKTTEGEMVVRILARCRPEDGREFQETGELRFLRRHRISSHHQGFHDPGRRSVYQGSGEIEPYGRADPAIKIKAEFNDRPHERGVLLMARFRDPDSAGSQFFICLAPRNASRSSIHGVRQIDQRR